MPDRARSDALKIHAAILKLLTKMVELKDDIVSCKDTLTAIFKLYDDNKTFSNAYFYKY